MFIYDGKRVPKTDKKLVLICILIPLRKLLEFFLPLCFSSEGFLTRPQNKSKTTRGAQTVHFHFSLCCYTGQGLGVGWGITRTGNLRVHNWCQMHKVNVWEEGECLIWLLFQVLIGVTSNVPCNLFHPHAEFFPAMCGINLYVHHSVYKCAPSGETQT